MKRATEFEPSKPYVDPWPVSAKRWSAYLDREVVLAMENIKRCGQSTLSSDETVRRARELMR